MTHIREEELCITHENCQCTALLFIISTLVTVTVCCGMRPRVIVEQTKYMHLMKNSDPSVKHVIITSDSAVVQNRNQCVTYMLLFAVHTLP